MTLANFGHSYEANTPESAATSSAVAGMYRGIQVKFSKTSEVTPVQLEATGLYRGVPIKFSQARTAPRSYLTLSYRGVQYSC